MAEYTPTTDAVRSSYRFDDVPGVGSPVSAQRGQAFDRWYAAEKAKWQAEALRDAALDAGRIFDKWRPALYDWLSERADRIESEGE